MTIDDIKAAYEAKVTAANAEVAQAEANVATMREALTEAELAVADGPERDRTLDRVQEVERDLSRAETLLRVVKMRRDKAIDAAIAEQRAQARARADELEERAQLDDLLTRLRPVADAFVAYDRKLRELVASATSLRDEHVAALRERDALSVIIKGRSPDHARNAVELPALTHAIARLVQDDRDDVDWMSEDSWPSFGRQPWHWLIGLPPSNTLDNDFRPLAELTARLQRSHGAGQIHADRIRELDSE